MRRRKGSCACVLSVYCVEALSISVCRGLLVLGGAAAVLLDPGPGRGGTGESLSGRRLQVDGAGTTRDDALATQTHNH